jgi:hypothetical protein
VHDRGAGLKPLFFVMTDMEDHNSWRTCEEDLSPGQAVQRKCSAVLCVYEDSWVKNLDYDAASRGLLFSTKPCRGLHNVQKQVQACPALPEMPCLQRTWVPFHLRMCNSEAQTVSTPNQMFCA